MALLTCWADAGLGRAVESQQSEPCTFRELQERCETISPTVLNSRLKERMKRWSSIRKGLSRHTTGRELCPSVRLGVWAKKWATKLPG
jgi:DNA-binding HxlR family transcriptional regulator